MKFAEPLESQKLSFLLEKAASREAMMWKAGVPKKTSTQVSSSQIGSHKCDHSWTMNLSSGLATLVNVFSHKSVFKMLVLLVAVTLQ